MGHPVYIYKKIAQPGFPLPFPFPSLCACIYKLPSQTAYFILNLFFYQKRLEVLAQPIYLYE